jgi:DtxR family Mn-dependent transcriptional regulator
MRKKKISASLEDYLEAIYKIIEEKQGVKAVEVSRRLGVGRSSVTEALKTLAEKKLVNYGRYDVISLTYAGEKIAEKVILKHKVLYEFFTEILGVDENLAQENACVIEHVITEDILKRLISFIEFNKQFYCHNNNYLEEYKKFYNEVNQS